MNARFLERFIIYREKNQMELARMILSQKILAQFTVIAQRKNALGYHDALVEARTIPSALLIEARAARFYWQIWSEQMKKKVEWKGRIPHGKDPINVLLDIGYHYATGKIIRICEEINLPTELGIFHKAQSGRAHPLAYDFIEWIRPLAIDRELLVFMRKKKKPVETVDEKMISLFVFRVKKAFEKNYYNKKLGYCISLEYWIRLNLLEFMGAVNANVAYEPVFPSLRHETRCKKAVQEDPGRRKLTADFLKVSRGWPARRS